jgi:outer membrane biosynthesis protein TonB
LGFLIFFFSRPEWKPREKLKGELADLAELKALQITLTRSKLEIKARQKRRKEKSQVEKEDSYEQDMVRSLDMEDQEKTETLSQSKVQAIINAKSKVLYSCIYREVQQNPSLKRVDIRFVIHSNGQVGGVTVSQGSEEFQTCIRTKMRKITFPSFSGPKVGAHFSLLVEQ